VRLRNAWSSTWLLACVTNDDVLREQQHMTRQSGCVSQTVIHASMSGAVTSVHVHMRKRPTPKRKRIAQLPTRIADPP
jgi:Na+-translocating ferredoxin:NAD+ oxidoreductase RnfC subunit